MINRIAILLMLAFPVWSMLDDGTITSLAHIKTFEHHEWERLNKRYKELATNPELFSEEEFATINELQLAPIIANVILHKHIKLIEAQELIAFATTVQESQLQFSVLEPRIKRYIKNKEPVFPALTKAIEREHFHRWKLRKARELAKDDALVLALKDLSLKKYESDKILNAYSTCVMPFTNEFERATFMQAKFHPPVPDYPAPRHEHKKVKVRETSSHDDEPQTRAYSHLLEAAKTIADREQLSPPERLIMSKCIAEQSLRYFVPSHHLVKTIKKSRAMKKKPPAEAFFMNSGMCGSFAGIVYNVAIHIGLKDHVFLTRKGVHFYIEFEYMGNWYHLHPFNSVSKSDLTAFTEGSLPGECTIQTAKQNTATEHDITVVNDGGLA